MVADSSDSDASDEEDKKEKDAHAQDWEKKRKRRTKEDIEKEIQGVGDLYAILGIEEKSLDATEADVKSAYKKMALIYHPDKIGENITDSDKEIWLKVQNAYETLVDPVRKRRYDSAMPFNDAIPQDNDDITDANFYETFNVVFIRNSRFAKKTPTPDIGDENTPMEQVYKFYRYWDNFETWREFTQFFEYDVREAADRYERRYMENENKRVGAKHMKKEKARLIKLVETAYKRDPRIKNAKMQDELEKKKKKQDVKDKKDMARKVIQDKFDEIE